MIFRDIPNYEGLYQATSNGQIYALPRTWVTYRNGIQKRDGRFIGKMNKNGYCYVSLTNSKGVKKGWLIHRLVAITFIENIHNKPDINHINGIKSDNRIDNLEWCTHKENIQHSFKIGLGNISAANKSWEKKVIDTKTNEQFDSVSKAADCLNMKRKTLSMMLNGKRTNKTSLSFL